MLPIQWDGPGLPKSIYKRFDTLFQTLYYCHLVRFKKKSIH